MQVHNMQLAAIIINCEVGVLHSSVFGTAYSQHVTMFAYSNL